MRTSAAFSSPLGISDFALGSCGSPLSKIRVDSFGPCWCNSEGGVGHCSCFVKAKCYQMPPPTLSSLSSDIRRNSFIGGQSSARARRLQLWSLDGQTSFATVAGEPSTPCDSCNGKGWLVCDFCKGQKTNVQAKNNRIYRRCPSCRTAGVVICPRCKVFKCVSFPDDKDTGIAL